MQYFTSDFIDFFKELAANNNRDWFQENKKRYENSVKKPFNAFISDLITEIKKHDPELSVEPKDCILRINRDIRFSKDKTPYNLHYTALISRAGRKDKSIPGLYLRFSPEMVGIMGGCYGPSKEQLEAIRTEISNDLKRFQETISAKDFAEKFSGIIGEAHKRIPKELKEVAEEEPLIMNKQFYFMAEREPALITSENLLEEVMNYWHTMRPVNDYFAHSIQLK